MAEFRDQIKTTTADHEAGTITLVLKDAPDWSIVVEVTKYPTDHDSGGNVVCNISVQSELAKSSPKRFQQIKDWVNTNQPHLIDYVYWVAHHSIQPVVRT